MVLDLSPEKIFVLAVLALLVLGPDRLPQAARALGRLVGHLRSLSASVQGEMRDVLQEPTEVFGAAVAEFHPSSIRQTLRRGVIDTITPPGPVSGPSSKGSTPTPAAPEGASAVMSGPGPGGAVPTWPGSAFVAHPDDPSLN